MEIRKKLQGAFPESAIEKRDRLPAGRQGDHALQN
jgi:hypothetical protein